MELANNADFSDALILADHTAKDFNNPGDTLLVFTPAKVGQASSLSPNPSVDPTARTLDGLEARPTLSARYIRITATRLWERTRDYIFALAELQVFSAGTNVARAATVTALDSIEAGRWSKKNLVDGYGSRAKLNDFAPSTEQRAHRRELEAELARLSAERQRLFDSLLPAEHKTESARLESRLGEITKALAALPPPQQVYAAASDFKPEGSFIPPQGMRAVHLLARGDVKQPRELVSPAGLSCVPGPDSSFNLATNHTEGDRRAALARWLTDPRNLQTRRSIVNRVWQYHFGRGLVDTSNDFGHMGSAPTHPELLDWLAFWFQENGESLKKLHRLIVTSHAYRQTSLIYDSRFTIYETNSGPRVNRKSNIVNPAELADADNRLLWRQNRTRLDAECIHDAMLAASGKLDLTMGGPSDRQFHFKDDHSPVYDYTRFDVDSPAGRRRSIYRLLVRSVPDPFMDCLDTADPSQLVARRNTTLTALQALATLNNPFVLKQCEHFAERLQKLAPDVPGQIDTAYRLAFSRLPTSEERERLAAYASQHGLANACRVLFNSTEFMFVD